MHEYLKLCYMYNTAYECAYHHKSLPPPYLPSFPSFLPPSFPLKSSSYATRTCPLCKEQVEDIEEEVRLLEEALSSNGSSRVRDIVDRVEEFGNLVLIGEH